MLPGHTCGPKTPRDESGAPLTLKDVIGPIPTGCALAMEASEFAASARRQSSGSRCLAALQRLSRYTFHQTDSCASVGTQR